VEALPGDGSNGEPDVSDVTDDELFEMYRDGDADAFDVLFDRYRASVYNFARMLLGHRDGAEDVLQEAFLRVARTAGTYEARGLFRPWLMRIVRNLCVSRRQAERARHRVVAESGLDVAEPRSRAPSPPECLERDERLTRLRCLIHELPERQREALVLYAFERMRYREIAEVLDVPINTVKTLIHRARAALAQALE
jgi:RNA polymerase sigma-70 factor (ECF subfamily)